MRELEDVALAFDRACGEAPVAYAFVGGLAVLAWGQPRTPIDIDALVNVGAPDVARLVAAAGRNALQVSAENLSDAIQHGHHANVLDQATSLRVKLKSARTPEELAGVENAVDIPFGGGKLRIVCAENAVAFNLRVGSRQDITDARSILARRAGKLDDAYLDRVCSPLRVASVLRRLQREVARGLRKT